MKRAGREQGGQRACAWLLIALTFVGPIRHGLAAPAAKPKPAAAPPAPRPPDPAKEAARALVAIADADPLALARVVNRFSDDVVLSLLAQAQPVEVRIAAARACPWLRVPERALARLTELAAGRDPDLAPAAAHAVLQIAQRVDAATLARHEQAPAAFAFVLKSLRALSEDARVVAHIRLWASAAAQLLAAAGVPEPEPTP